MNIIEQAIPAIIAASQEQLLEDFTGISICTLQTNDANNNIVQDGTDYVIPTFANNLTYHYYGAQGLIVPDQKTLEFQIADCIRYLFAFFKCSLRLPNDSTLTQMYCLLDHFVYNPDTQQKTGSNFSRTRISGISDNYYHECVNAGSLGGINIIEPGEIHTVAPVVQAGVGVSDLSFTCIAFS